MARRSDHSRDELHELALTAAERILARQGPAGLTTRAVAAKMGYTVGSLYLVFRNLDDLILQLNARTLDELYVAMQSVQTECDGPRECLLALAYIYTHFAFAHEARWRFIFEQPLPSATPAWFSERGRRMFAMVEEKLGVLAPRRGARERQQAARALWSGVHGVCMLGLTGRLEQRGVASVQQIARSLVTHYLAGFTGTVVHRRTKRK